MVGLACGCRTQPQGAAPRVLSRKSSHIANSSFRGGGSTAEAASAMSTPPSPSPLRPGPGSAKTQGDSGAAGPRNVASGGSSRPPMPPLPPRPAPVLPSKPPVQDRLSTLRGNSASLETRSIPDSAASLESAGSDQLLEQAAAAAATVGIQSRSQLGTPALAPVQPPLPGKEGKGKNAALRFLSRLGKKKDKYQSKTRDGLLQPVREEAEAVKEGKRTLAGKLMNRSKARLAGGGDAGSSAGSLDRLAFGGHQLSQDSERQR